MNQYKTPNLTLDHPAWKVAHARYLDAVSRQKRRIRIALAAEVGDTFDGFLDALADRLLVIGSHFLEGGLHYVVSVATPEGYAPLAVIHAEELGLNDPDTQLAEILNGA